MSSMSGTLSEYYEEDDALYQEEEIEEQVDRIIRERGVSYPSEIARLTLNDASTIKKVLSAMQRKGEIKRLPTPPHRVPEVLKKRMSELWSRGIRGYESFQRMNLVVPANHEVKYGA